MTNQTLDKPEEKRLFGLDLKINRFHLINPIEGELMILKMPTKTRAWIRHSFFFFLVSLVPIFIAVNMLMVSGVGSMMIFFTVVAAIFLFMSGSTIYMAKSKKANWLFAADKLIYTSSFGSKKVIQRENVISIFITETIGKSKGGTEKYVHYGLMLRVKPKGLNFGAYYLFVVDEPDSKETIHANGINKQNAKIAADEALQIAHIIADFWNIPVSV